MTLPGRQVPDCGPNLMFTDNEIDFLRDYAREHDMTPPERLGDAVRLVAHLGGYRDRKHDPEPGNQIMSARPDPPLERHIRPSERVSGRPEACIAAGRLTRCNANSS